MVGEAVPHTPGPWRVTLHSSFGDDGQPVTSAWIEAGDFHSLAIVLPGPQMRANVFVMAAAPELLAACKHALVIAEEYDEHGFAGTIVLKDMLRAAITRAEGR